MMIPALFTRISITSDFLFDLSDHSLYLLLVCYIAHIAVSLDAFLFVGSNSHINLFLIDIIEADGCAPPQRKQMRYQIRSRRMRLLQARVLPSSEKFTIFISPFLFLNFRISRLSQVLIIDVVHIAVVLVLAAHSPDECVSSGSAS